MSGSASGRDKQAAVVLVNCAIGGELGVVRDALTRSLNTPTVLIEHTDLVSTPMSLDLNTGLLNVDGCRVRPAVVWARHSSAGAIMAQAQPPGSVKLLDAASWAGLLSQVAASTTATLPGSTPAAPAQLVDAVRVGVKTPRTVFTTDVIEGVQLMGTQRVIVKTPDFRLFEPDPRNWPACLPMIIDRDAVTDGGADGARPFVVQEYIAHARELRIYYLNGGICAFEVSKPEPASLWRDPASVTVTRTGCPPLAAEAVRKLCARWNLRYGAFDLLVSHAGEPVFLEVNPDGDWLWYERKARWHGVSFMAAVMVYEMFVRVTS
jgi:hypothetical protein